MSTKNRKIVKHLLSLGVICFVGFLSSCEKKECPDNEPTGYPSIVYDACVDFADEDITLLPPCSEVKDTSITFYPEDFASIFGKNPDCGQFDINNYSVVILVDSVCENFETTGRVEAHWKEEDTANIFSSEHYISFNYINQRNEVSWGSGSNYWQLESTWPDSVSQYANNPIVHELTTNCRPQNIASRNRRSVTDKLVVRLISDHYTCNHEENVKLIEKYFSHFVVHFRYAKG